MADDDERLKEVIEMLSGYAICHTISTPFGGTPDKDAGAEMARLVAQEVNSPFLNRAAKEMFAFNPNEHLPVIASTAGMTPEDQGAQWLYLWGQVLEVTQKKKAAGSKVYVMKHKTKGILGGSQKGEIKVAELSGFSEKDGNLVYVYFEAGPAAIAKALEDFRRKESNRTQAPLTLDESNRSQLLPGFDDSSTKVTIPDSVTSIGNRAFYQCESLAQVTIPDSVTTIGDHAFYRCTSLQQVTIPDSVTSIGEHAFSYCKSLTEVTIPDSVTTIGDYAFHGCTSLQQVTIPDSVTTIGDNFFWGCKALQKVTIPDSVTTIGENAFAWCSSLQQVTIPDSVTTIGTCAFYGCDALREAKVPAALDISKVDDDGDGIFPEHTVVRRR